MKSRIVWIVLSVVMFIASICLILYYLWGNGYLWKAKTAPAAQTYEEFTYPSIDESQMAKITDFSTAAPTATSDPKAPTEPTQPIQIDCPVNFDELQSSNAEIIMHLRFLRMCWSYLT